MNFLKSAPPEWTRKLLELSKEFNTLWVPSPSRISETQEWYDYKTSEFYRKWLEAKVNLDEYRRHQEAGFPLFVRVSFGSINNWIAKPFGIRERAKRTHDFWEIFAD